MRSQFPTTIGKVETSGSNLRRLSISFNQEIIWFEVGMLWDATFLTSFQILRAVTTGDRVIVPGEAQDIEIPGPLPTITILAVMYADGGLEGDQITVAQLRDRRSALKAELKRILGLVVAEAQSRDADIPGAFDRLESAMSKLPSIVADGHTPQANAQRGAKDDVASLFEFMRHRQERNAHLNQLELIRELKERLERRIAGL